MLTVYNCAKQFSLKYSSVLLQKKTLNFLIFKIMPTNSSSKMSTSTKNFQCSNGETKQSQNDDLKNNNITLVACGSFNPVTYMHLRMFELAKDCLQECFPNCTVTSGIISPVGDSYGKPELISGQHRKEMCQLAVSSSSWIEVKPWELQQKEWTPTASVLHHHEKYVKEKYGSNGKVMLLCGADLLKSFSVKDLWLETELRKIVGYHGIVVVTRPSYNVNEIVHQSALLTELKHNIFTVSEHFTNDVSSTKVRAAIRQGKSIKYVVPDPVSEYIKKHNLYAEVAAPVADELAPLKKHRSKS